MAPRRGFGRGRVRRGHGGRTPRSCRGGLHGAAPMPSSSPLEEGFWRYDFLLCIHSQSATRVLLPYAFSAIVVEHGLDGLLLHLQGSCRSPSYVDLEVDSSRLIFLGSGWSLFAWRLNLRDSDMLCCRFDGESTVTVRAFDPSGNSMDPRVQESSSDGSVRSKSPTPSSSTAPSSATPPVVVPSPSALKRTSSLRSSGCAKGPCMAGGGLIFAGNFRKEAVQPEKKLVELLLQRS